MATQHTRLHRGYGWYNWVRRWLGGVELTASRITLIYAVFGMLALYLSDVLFVRYFSEPVLSQLQAVKGGVEVVVTAGLIFVLTSRSRRQLRAASREVERQRDELSMLHRVFRHNVRNHLNVIQGNTELLREDFAEHPALERCEQIITTCKKILQYAEQARRIRRVSADETGVLTVDLAETIQQVITDHPQVDDTIEITNAVPRGVNVQAHTMLEEALAELLTNSINHNEAPTPTINIELVSEEPLSHTAEFCITDNGLGIPETEIQALQQKRETQLLHSTGMGLWFVDWVIKNSKGELDIFSEKEHGTKVTIQLPVAHSRPRFLRILSSV